MLTLPRKPSSGPPEWMEWADGVEDALKASWPIDGFGTKVADAAGGGRSINVVGGGAAAAAAAEPGQLQVLDASDEDGTKIKVTVGQIFSGGSSRIPEIDGQSIFSDPPPTIDVAPADTLIYLELDLNDSGIVVNDSDAKILAGDSLPTSDETTAYIAIALLDVTGGDNPSVRIVQVLGGSQSYNRCPEWFTFPITYSHQFSRI